MELPAVEVEQQIDQLLASFEPAVQPICWLLLRLLLDQQVQSALQSKFVMHTSRTGCDLR